MKVVSSASYITDPCTNIAATSCPSAPKTTSFKPPASLRYCAASTRVVTITGIPLCWCFGCSRVFPRPVSQPSGKIGGQRGVAGPRGGYLSGNAQTSRPSSVNVLLVNPDHQVTVLKQPGPKGESPLSDTPGSGAGPGVRTSRGLSRPLSRCGRE